MAKTTNHKLEIKKSQYPVKALMKDDWEPIFRKMYEEFPKRGQIFFSAAQLPNVKLKAMMLAQNPNKERYIDHEMKKFLSDYIEKWGDDHERTILKLKYNL